MYSNLIDKCLSVKLNKSLNHYTGIINLSSYTLSNDEISLLSKNLKYCPTPPQTDLGCLKADIDKFFRSASLFLHFLDDKNKDNYTDSFESNPPGDTITPDRPAPYQHHDLKPKSGWTPPAPGLLEHVHQLVLRDIFNFTGQISVSRNLTKGEYKAISSLKNNHKIIIKPADKGSNVVIMNKTDYTQEGLRQLSDGQFYEKQAKDLTDHHYKLVKIEADRLLENKEITKTTYKYLVEECERTPRFYMLPKIHKQLLKPPGRPIVSSVNSPTEKISHLVDTIIGPLVPKTKSYLKDTGDFLEFVKSLPPLPQNCWLVILDVSALYTNIPHDEGRRAVMAALQKYRKSGENPSNNSILRLLDLVLKCNNFAFGQKHYLQKSGTAMGTRLAPNYANLFMADFEERHVYTYEKPPLWWKRFIDDVFCIYQGTEQELLEFLNHLNTCHIKEKIKFTYEYSKSQVYFLDTTVYRENNQLKTTLYVKATTGGPRSSSPSII